MKGCRWFLTHNADLLGLLSPQLEMELQSRNLRNSTYHEVKAILKRMMAGKRPDIRDVAKELGLTVRTLQRRLTDAG
jgi:transcriptional regulator with PAS, ATPase and Fis domain